MGNTSTEAIKRKICCPVCRKTYEAAATGACPGCGYPVLSFTGSRERALKDILAYRTMKGIRLSALYVGQQYRMGTYNGEEISWRVLAIKNDKALLISEKGLEAIPFHHSRGNVVWEECSLRKWMNENFYKAAFGPLDRDRILESLVTADGNPEHAVPLGKNTRDKIFALSIQEVNIYFKDDRERMTAPTERAGKNGAFVASSNQHGWWWLRTLGGDDAGVAAVGNTGLPHCEGVLITSKNVCARPAMWIEMPEDEANPDKIRVGRKYEMGNYYGEPIMWHVLAKDQEKALLLSEKGLEPRAFNTKFKDTNWNDCSLREWMNTDFIKKAFGPLDQKRIARVSVMAEGNKHFSTDPGMNTTDRIFLLSINEVEEYLTSDKLRQAHPTQHAKSVGAYVDSSTDCCWWWLRTPGQTGSKFSFVEDDGQIYVSGNYVTDENVCIRPAMWVKLES